MRIEIIGGTSSGVSTISGLYTDFDSLLSETDSVISALSKLKSFSYNMSGGIGILQNAISNVDVRLQAEENKRAALLSAKEKCGSFLQLVSVIDSQVSETVSKNQEEFYHLNEWSKPSALSVTLDSWYNNAKTWLSGALKGASDAIGHAWNVYNETDYSSLSDEELEKLCDDYIKLLESGELSSDDNIRLQSFLNYLASTEISPSISDSDKKKVEFFNSLYEKIHTEDAKKINSFFNDSAYNEDGTLKDGVSEGDINNIKYIAYKSKSPCHEVFFDNIAECHVESWNHDGSYYRCVAGKNNDTGADEARGVYLNFETGNDGIDNPRGAYNTFFHEIGHNQDDLLVGGYDADVSKNYVGINSTDVVASGKLYDVIYQDVENNFREAISSYSSSEAMISIDSTGQAKILDVLMGRADRNTLNPRLDFAYRKIYEDYTGKWKGIFTGKIYEGNEIGSLEGAGRDQVSDITGGITNNVTIGTYGHDSDGYWYSGKNSGDIVDGNISASGHQEMEFFAEYFAYEMTNDSHENYARRYFPNSYSAMDDSMKKEAAKIKDRS